MKPKLIGAGLAIVSAGVLMLVGMPSIDERIEEQRSVLNKRLASHELHIDPDELLDLMNNANFGLRILDLRDENEYNLFHIRDAERVTLKKLRDPEWVRRLPKRTVFVLVSNGEQRSERAYVVLAGWKTPNLYILAGGINEWMRRYGEPEHLLASPGSDCGGQECRGYVFEAALGDRHPESDPDSDAIAGKDYRKKVKPLGRVVRKAGGCG